MVRISLVPLKVCGFVWEAMWKRIDPANHIQKVNTQWNFQFVMCCASGETGYHLLFTLPHCLLYMDHTFKGFKC